MKISQLLNKPTPSVSSLAKKYRTTANDVEAQLKRGIQVEMEHTKDPQVAREIALDHLGEDLDYYKKLSKIEKTPVKESTLMELFDLNRVPHGVSGPQLISHNPYMTVYKFAIDNKKYELSFHPEDHEVEVAFSDATGATDITGAGNATKVFWAVAKGLDDYLKNNSIVKTIVFISFDDEPSRHKLYHMFSNRLAQHLGWHAGKKLEDSYVRWTVTREEKARATETHSLMELFDLNRVPEGVTPPEMVSDVTDKTIYQFSVRGRKYLCQFTDVDRDTYDLKFKDPEGRMTITRAGEATKVFWGVARAVSMFIKHKPVALLRFGASEPSRQKLYNMLSQKLALTLGWRREIIKYPDDPASYFRLYNPQYTKQPLEEGRSTSVIVVDVQPAYRRGNERLFERIIRFVNNQTGSVLMFVNAEQDAMTDDTVAEIKAYWEDVVRGEEWDPEDLDESPIDWSRFQIKDKGFGFTRAWIDQGISDRTIIKTIRLMYQNRVNDSRELFGGELSDDYALNFEQFIGPEFEHWMLSDVITVNWTSVAQLKRFNGSYIVGGGRNECLREVELLMNAFNIKYRRIDSMVYG